MVLNYLTSIKRLTPDIKSKALAHISLGYQRELTYRRSDGSFSAFGEGDSSGSTWLTAFVVKSFLQAGAHIDIEQSVIQKAVEFLFAQQKADGSFTEPGRLIDKKMQGGTGSAGTLTAYVLVAILEAKSNSLYPKYQRKINRALEFCSSQLETNHPYELALIVHAFYLAGSQHSDAAYDKLMKLVKRGPGGLIHWSGRVTDTFNNRKRRTSENTPISDYLELPDSLEIESTAYALLTLANRSDLHNGIPAMKWLISKQNSNGGFASTQDTVIGLQ